MAKKVVSRFPARTFLFDAKRDLHEVEQFGFVNLNEALEKGIIPSVVEATGDKFNGVANPGTLISHATDVFDGIRKAEYVRRTLDSLDLNKTERKVAEAAVQAATAAAGAPGAAGAE